MDKEDSFYRLKKCVKQIVYYKEQHTHSLEHTL